MAASARPSSPPHRRRGVFTAQVRQNLALCTEHRKLVLAVPGLPPSVPGQFVQIECGPELNEAPAAPQAREWEAGQPLAGVNPDFVAPRAFLRRPFSIGGRRDLAEGISEIDIIYRVVGRGTGYLTTLQAGESVSLLGPLGNGFVVPPELQLALLVGGGVGVPPMVYLAEHLARVGKAGLAFVGAQRRDLLPLTLLPQAPPPSPTGEPVRNVQEFAAYGIATVLTTDDGSLGMKGLITAALRQFLETGEGSLKRVVYCCGPTPMMKAVAAVAAEFGVPCQLSLEQPMACGMGTCQSCVIKWRDPRAEAGGAAEWVYKLTCTDGPVFEAAEIVW